jgi:hypothetical protein
MSRRIFIRPGWQKWSTGNDNFRAQDEHNSIAQGQGAASFISNLFAALRIPTTHATTQQFSESKHVDKQKKRASVAVVLRIVQADDQCISLVHSACRQSDHSSSSRRRMLEDAFRDSGDRAKLEILYISRSMVSKGSGSKVSMSSWELAICIIGVPENVIHVIFAQKYLRRGGGHIMTNFRRFLWCF